MADVDVFVENFTIVDWELHELWIRGLSAVDAVSFMKEKGILNQYPGVTNDLLVSDVNDHYRLFSMQEHLLLTVGNFKEQLLYQMTPETQTKLIERYYGLDSSLCRELLGKKLSSRVRKDLDEVAEKCGVSLKSCRRQFDNIKRVFKTIEDMPGHYAANIQQNFGLSKNLAEEYATIVFVASFKFEMNKRKLQSLSFDVIKCVCLILMEDWVDYDEESEPTLDKEFLVSLKELKSLVDKDKEHRNAVVAKLQSSDQVTGKSRAEIEANFKTLSRNILSLGQSLSSNKEVRDFFVHLVEKLSDPLRALGVTKSEAGAFLTAYRDAVTSGNVLTPDGSEQVRRTFNKFMNTLVPCLMEVY